MKNTYFLALCPKVKFRDFLVHKKNYRAKKHFICLCVCLKIFPTTVKTKIFIVSMTSFETSAATSRVIVNALKFVRLTTDRAGPLYSTDVSTFT